MAALARLALRLALLLALVALAAAQTPYNVLYVSHPACDLATDGAGFIYVGLCTASGGGLQKFNSSGSLVAQFQQQYATALNVSASSYTQPLTALLYEISASGTIWVLDDVYGQLVGVSNVGLPTASTSVISITAELDSRVLTIAPNSNNLWLIFQGLPSAPIQQLSPTGAVLQTWNSTNVPGLTDFYVLGLYAAASGSLYVGGCYPLNAWIYLDEEYGYGVNNEFYYARVGGCEIRQFSASGVLQQTFRPTRPPSNFFNFTGFDDFVADNAGAVYSYDSFNGVAYKWSSTGVQALVNVFSDIHSFAYATSTNTIYALTSSDRFAVVTVNPTTLTAQSSFEIDKTSISNDVSVALSPDGGILYAVGFSNKKVISLNATTGAVLGSFGADVLVDSEWVATDAAGNVYVVDSALFAVLKFSSAGQLLMNFSSAAQPLLYPYGMAINPLTNEVLVCDLDSAAIVVFSPNGSLARVIDTSQYINPAYSYYSQPFGVVVSSKGVIVYSDIGFEDVVILTPQSNTSMTLFNKEINFYGSFGSAASALPIPLALQPQWTSTSLLCLSSLCV
jgi:hypothetical protein